MKILIITIGSCLYVNNIYCKDTIFNNKPTKDTIYIENISQPGEIILKYREVLESETKAHRDYLETLYTRITAIFGFVGTIVLAVLYFLWGKSSKGIQNQVNDNFKLKVDDIIKEQVSEIDKLYKKKFNYFTSWMSKVILELSETAINQKDDKPLVSVDYSKLKGKTILWIDDKPENNEQHIEVFKSVGVDFELAKTSEEARNKLKLQSFDLIISNMGRPPKENEPDNPEEGINFLKILSKNKNMTPIIVYTKPETQKKYGDLALKNGARAVTQGYTGLFKLMLKHLT